MKKINLNSSVFTLVHQYPEIVEIMASLGFTEIRKKAVVNSVGKMMTLPKGAKMRHISMESIEEALRKNGFEIETETSKPAPAATQQRKGIIRNPFAGKGNLSDERIALLKGYLKRLSEGENLDSVRADFVEKFSDVAAADIMRAEQELIAEGQPITDVQRLCDVHSALFHGSTREERIANAEEQVKADLREQQQTLDEAHKSKEKAHQLAEVDGHPLQTFMRENDAIEQLLRQVKKGATDGSVTSEQLQQLRQISIHYAKKGDLLYPLLATRYDVTGPQNVMWSVDDEIRAALGKLSQQQQHDSAWQEQLLATVKRAKEMIYKENFILYPICASRFSDEEWQQIYRDSADYAVCLDVEPRKWKAVKAAPATASTNGDMVQLGSGSMTVAQLQAMLNTLPMEISFVDDKNINRYFNDGEKVFKRPQMAIGREVFSCHPPKIQPMVRAIIDDFRNGKRDSVPVWLDKNGRTYLINYMAVRDAAGNYLGTAEFVQDMEFAKSHFEGEQ